MNHLRPPALVLGVPIADITMAETLQLIVELVAEGRARGRTFQIATVNVDFLVNSLDDPDLGAILRQADVCIADGMPVVWGSRALGMPIRERVAGSDLVPLLVEASATTGLHVHVFGSTPEVADSARILLRDRYPDARFSIDPGPMVPDVDAVDAAVLDSIAAVDADILCVALGNPKQERFIRAHRDRLGTPVMIGVGGSLDMLVGKRRRAPRWVQTLGMEWIVRAAQEPRRLGRRYAHDIATFGPAFVRNLRENRRRRFASGVQLAFDDDAVRLLLAGENVISLPEWSAAANRIRAGATLCIDANDVTTTRDSATAQLLGLVRVAEWARTPVVWSRLQPSLQAALLATGVSAPWSSDHGT
jgi:N-acetylglucosaminyldiphosphoundecaprenol N-acetyl-beta-D-mannosaminyltransferase